MNGPYYYQRPRLHLRYYGASQADPPQLHPGVSQPLSLSCA
jgi:hypothetical protein